MLVSYPEEKLIRQIILGCERFVCNMEDKRYSRKFKPRKISQRKRIQLSVLYPSLLEPYTDKGFRPVPEVKKRLSEIETVFKPLVYPSLKTLVNVNYLQKRTLKEHSEFSSINTKYSESNYVNSLKKLVSKTIPRVIIYYKLLESNILSRYLTVLNYSELLMYKHIDVEQVINARRAKGLIDQQKDIEDFRQEYTKGQKSLQNKTNREILFNAEILAKEQIQSKPLDDPTYTEFFIVGGISYGEIENLPYEK